MKNLVLIIVTFLSTSSVFGQDNIKGIRREYKKDSKTIRNTKASIPQKIPTKEDSSKTYQNADKDKDKDKKDSPN
jgi:hypothetical protein